ncbi:MAG: hypothetical protein JXC85_02430 [Candidatus Aenigmarchaeota archaeon]|nr:hypothetical protein [Candidatus Aenigmarchaeota archaeon]
MANLAVIGVTLAVVAGLALSAYHFWRNRNPGKGIMLFLLPFLAYLIWHFSVEAYNWGDVWSNAPDISLELSIAVALIDIKLLFTVFMLILWVFVWNSLNRGRKASK